MSGKKISFDDKKIKKSEFYENEKVFKIDNVAVNQIVVSKKELYSTKNASKYFIEYNNNDIIRPLFVRFQQMTGYSKKSDENIRVSSKHVLKNSNKIQEKVKKLIRIDFESKPTYGDDDKYIKAKIKIYPEGIIRNFHTKRKSTMEVFINNNVRFCY